MARINLLPWREELRRERQQQFMMSLLMTAVFAVILVFLVGFVYDTKIKHQQFRNDLVRGEIRKLEVRIKKIDQLERTRARLISRKRVIEQLQASRSATVELLDSLAKSIPVGVTLASVRQQGSKLALTGSSQSNARVSAYLRELDQSELFLNPQLEFVRTTNQPASNTEAHNFSIVVNIRPPQSKQASDGFDDQGGLE